MVNQEVSMPFGNSVFKVCCSIVLMLGVSMCYSDEQGMPRYDELSQTFRGKINKLTIAKSAAGQMKKGFVRKKDGWLTAVTAETWADNKSFILCEISNGVLSKVQLVNRACSEPISLKRFDEYCRQPMIWNFGSYAYLNLVQSTGRYLVGDIFKLQDSSLSQAVYDLKFDSSKLEVEISYRDKSYNLAKLGPYNIGDTNIWYEIFTDARVKLRPFLYSPWKKVHDKRVADYKKKQRVFWGGYKDRVTNEGGHWYIPMDPPSATRTVTWTETVWHNSTAVAHTDYGDIDVDVAIPETVERSREKPVTINTNYWKLREELEEFEKGLELLENEQPPLGDDWIIKTLTEGTLLFKVIER